MKLYLDKDMLMKEGITPEVGSLRFVVLAGGTKVLQQYFEDEGWQDIPEFAESELPLARGAIAPGSRVPRG